MVDLVEEEVGARERDAVVVQREREALGGVGQFVVPGAPVAEPA
jgi:hypothetical protein